MSVEANEKKAHDWSILMILKYPALRACAPRSPCLFRGFPLEKDVFPLRATMEAELSDINFIAAMEDQEGERALRRIVSA